MISLLLAALIAQAPLTPVARVTIAPGFGDALNRNYWHAATIVRHRGRLLLARYHGATHGGADGFIALQDSGDGGRTWSKPFDVFRPNNLGVPPSLQSLYTGPVLKVLRSGRLLLAFDEDDTRANLIPARKIWLSHNDGDPMDPAAWSSPIDVGAFGGNRTTLGSWGPELADGTLTLACYTKETSSSFYTARLLQSTDGGASWAQRSIIANNNAYPYEEPQIGLLDDGTWMGLVRDDDGGGRTWLVRSFDRGLSWTRPVFAFPAWDWPAWIQLEDGLIVCTTRAPDAQGSVSVIWTSADRGATWQGPFAEQDPLPGTFGRSMFGGPIELTRNIVGIIAGDEPLNLPNETPTIVPYTRSRGEWSLWLEGAPLASQPSEDSVLRAAGFRPDAPSPDGSELVAWWDAEASAQRSGKLRRTGSDGAPIVLDLSGNRNHLIQGGSLPWLIRYPIDGTGWIEVPYLWTDGSVNRSLISPILDLPQPYTLCITFRSTQGSADVFIAADTNPAGPYMKHGAGGGRTYIRAGSPAPALFSSGPIDMARPAVTCAVYAGASSSLHVSGSTVAVGAIGTMPLHQLRLGGSGGGQLEAREIMIARGTNYAKLERALMLRSRVAP